MANGFSLGGINAGANQAIDRRLQQKQFGLQEKQFGFEQEQAEKNWMKGIADTSVAGFKDSMTLIEEHFNSGGTAGNIPKAYLIGAATAIDNLDLLAKKDPTFAKQAANMRAALEAQAQRASILAEKARNAGEAEGAGKLAAAEGGGAAAAGLTTATEASARQAVDQAGAGARIAEAGAAAEASAAGAAKGKMRGELQAAIDLYGENSPQAQAVRDAAAGGDGKEKPKLSDVSSLRGQFTNLSGDFINVRDAFTRIAVSAANPSAAGDLAMIFNFMKMLDPGSTVREGEFANAQNAAGVPNRIVARYNSILNGEKLTEEQRADFLSQAEGLFGAQLRSQKTLQDTYRGIAERQGMTPEDAVPDFTAGLEGSAGPVKKKYRVENGALVPVE